MWIKWMGELIVVVVLVVQMNRVMLSFFPF